MIALETLSARRQRDFLAAVRRSRELHGRWVSPPSTAEQYRRYLVQARQPDYLAHVVCTASGELVGVISISEIVRGVFRSGYLGYYAFVPHAGHGLMREGLRKVVRLSFREYGLHRLEANIQPGNDRSVELVKGVGFRLEGYSPRYLKIGGKWRDHERWAMTIEDWTSRRGEARVRS